MATSSQHLTCYKGQTIYKQLIGVETPVKGFFETTRKIAVFVQ
ncbi:hypothetical protein GMES_0732 [Paraglaciecola mesophila KMM 241]|uniref:Uncharacterized protein n=1 Tax=Paraglaciecola mesophila KMM 241 TaxID=1128912 RepID=K6YXY1_9ALTE|nr:hypothetical protein GMES_0732 [Paraglaciecola mesophila KMM 241]